MDAPNALSASDAVQKIRAGELDSLALVNSCLQRIDETDGQINAWAHIDRELALKHAEEADMIRRNGYAMGPLHGIPVGLKDIIDTKDLPTERGTSIHKGRQPSEDAAIVDNLREAGAIIMGKTVTTELAFLHGSETRNPHNVAYSPGGSSSGSAAAVAAFHVPLAVGTQTNGSVVRPASYCGVFGLKPTRGMISRSGILQTSKNLDQVGVFGRTLEDVALLTNAIQGFDPRDPLSFARPRPDFVQGCHMDVPVEPDIAWFDLPYLDLLPNDAKSAFEEVLEILGPRVEKLPVSENFADLVRVQQTIHQYEFVHHQQDIISNHWDLLSDTLRPIVDTGKAISDTQYQDAIGVMHSAQNFFKNLYLDYDAVLTPSSAGGAPTFGPATGDPIFCTIWTLCGLPCVSMPMFVGENNMPFGMQLVGATERDDRLLRTANWILTQMRSDAI